tara:strand:+ start:70 stop:465 length:396 start_codon:yes stop_codon:yes gene_type:complete
MGDLRSAMQMCKVSHYGQHRDDGTPYWTHPFAVADMVVGLDNKKVAYLHDVVEDTPTTLNDVGLIFGKDIENRVAVLTRNKDERYFDYIHRVIENNEHEVKIADICHNYPTSNPSMQKRYRKALLMLSEGK